jgi:phosphatidylglycerol:prolipoprotein diacylglycerol transferase
MNFLHSFLPQPILISFGFVSVYWYGFLMALAIFSGLLVSLKVAKWHGVNKEIIYDLFFYIAIAGFIGARVFYVLYNFNYFWQNPLDIFKIWQGGLAIHGALIFGFLALWWFVKRLSLRGMEQSGMTKQSRENSDATPLTGLLRRSERLGTPRNDNWFWLLAAIIAPGLALGQAIGRFGNYFNQELFGLPTTLPWGIPIAFANRPAGFEMFEYFHPTFLYESIGDFAIFILLLLMHWFLTHNISNGKRVTSNGLEPFQDHSFITHYSLLITLYLLLYSSLRFIIEFLRIDPTAGSFLGMRATMFLALFGVIVSFFLIFYYSILPLNRHRKKKF